MTSLSGDLILPDNGRIINRSGKVFGSDNISYLTYTIDVHILTNQNDTVPIATTTTSCKFVYNRSKGHTTVIFSGLTLPANAGGYADKILGFTWTSTLMPTRVSSVFGTLVCVDSTGKAGIARLVAPSGSSGTPLNLRIRSNTTLTGMTSTGAIEVSIQPVTFSTDTSI